MQKASFGQRSSNSCALNTGCALTGTLSYLIPTNTDCLLWRLYPVLHREDSLSFCLSCTITANTHAPTGAISTDGYYVFSGFLYHTPHMSFFITIFIIIMWQPLKARFKYAVCDKLVVVAANNMAANFFTVIACKIMPPNYFSKLLLRCVRINFINYTLNVRICCLGVEAESPPPINQHTHHTSMNHTQNSEKKLGSNIPVFECLCVREFWKSSSYCLKSKSQYASASLATNT